MKMMDVTIIGGGPAGLMAAIASAEQGAKTMLIDKGNKLGKKLAISGGGRCNVTNRLPADEVMKHIPGNGRFLYSAFSIFDNYDIIDFFEGLGVALKEEDHGRMFPVSNNANDVVNALLHRLDELNVTVKKNTVVKAIDYRESTHQIVIDNQDNLETKAVVIAAGGKAVPHTGSTGDAYPWAKKAGHTITELYPTEVPIVSNEDFIRKKLLQGTALRNAALSVYDEKRKKVITHQMDMLFTHFGISGPAVLRCSQYIVKLLMKGLTHVEVRIDSIPDKTVHEIVSELSITIDKNSKRTFKNVVKGLVPERYLDFLLERNDISQTLKSANISREKLEGFVNDLKAFSFQVHDSLPLQKAFVTGGGVSIKEVVPSTMQSKLMHGLYFCGEVLDIHGYTGGYNITSAMVTGRVAGMHAAWESLSS
ncbi:aminoacetone oxidase family FAD-binding enzyme [Gracilibacillus salitolerans]|uniref:Aminoacetone oxidase family FAD-binding enzyme n=1 Tax=Gracilibacillus salitolerans TaxID=2663022 RepID=A0A5Q2TL50_9BACI|nr:NAD(P)/FAD-dependent oxidoreductase [Gracilibacillus salitolerans]QGH35375.1 aminoacetone oxidase family FAD-binding enzyme [Gracilibacillus salitolerans]